ncbi:MAG: uroporphyrinogen decarboxylase family protein [Chloroflexota bacterium]
MSEKKPTPVSVFPDNWVAMSIDEKYDFFKGVMLSTEDKAFVNAEVAEKYKRRMTRLYDAVELKEPDRVPTLLLSEGYIARRAGYSQADYFYNTENIRQAAIKFHEDFPEMEYASTVLPYPGEAFDLLGIKMLRWPGGDRPDALPDNTSWQYVEGEYMPASDYDELIQNPEGYVFRKWFPSVFENLKALAAFPSLFAPMEPATVAAFLAPLAGGPIRDALNLLLEAADKALPALIPAALAYNQIITQFGSPRFYGGLTFAPFDIIGDTMRGTKGVMLDMYRNPDKLMAACEAVVPATIKFAVDGAYANKRPFVLIPLHKGADGFMSEEQFTQFYWPSFKKSMEGMIEAGLIPVPFVEGSYNNRLDILSDWDVPKGKVVFGFDQTDMKTAKEKLGDKFAIFGNVSGSLFATGTPEEMDAYTKDLLESCAPGGGFMLGSGSPIEFTTPEVLRTYLGATKKYGVS